MQPLQILFFTSTVGLLSTSIVAVLAVASPALRATSFVLFVLFCNGVPFCYQIMSKYTEGKFHADVPSAYLAYWGSSLATFLMGLLIKSSMMPEKVIRQPWADIWCQSHQIWHLCINGGFVLGTFLAWDVYLNWRKENECPDAH